MEVVVCLVCGHNNPVPCLYCSKCGTKLSVQLTDDEDESPLIKSIDNSTDALISDRLELDETPDSPVVDDSYEKIQREIRNTGILFLVLGLISFGISLVSSNFQTISMSDWSLMILLLGLLSLIFKDFSMYLLYGVAFTWTALPGLFNFQGGWVGIALGLFILFIAFRFFRRFFLYRNPESLPDNPLISKRSRIYFPQLGCLFVALSWIHLIGYFIYVIFFSTDSIEFLNSSSLGTLDVLASIIAILGFTLCLASLLLRFRNKTLSILGIIAGTPFVLIWLIGGLLGY